jgi:putative ABC transport system permease protein
MLWIDSLLQDFRFGFRMLRKNPAPALAALGALALAIGACTAAFSLIDALLLRPLPVAAPDRLVALSYPAVIRGRSDGENFSYPAFRRFREAAGPDADLFGVSFSNGLAEVAFSNSESERARLNWISGSAFGALGVPPALGRTLNNDDGLHGDSAVLGYAFLKRRFGGSPDVLDRAMTANGRTFRIAGVAAKGFNGLEPGFLTDIWLPIESMRASVNNLADPSIEFLDIWGRLKPGVTPEALRQKLQPAFTATRRELARGFEAGGIPPGEMPRILTAALKVTPSGTGRANIVRLQFERPLWILGIVAALVLLIACSNIANLFAARAEAREREMAVRAAVGAGRMRLLQQAFVECALIAAPACLIGLALARGAAPLLVDRLMPSTMPAYLDLELNARGLLFTAIAGTFVTLLFGAIPAWRAATTLPEAALKSGNRSSARLGATRFLVVAQVAFSFVVLFLGGLLLISFRNLMNVDLGFTKQGVLLLGLDGRRVNDAAPNRDAIVSILNRVRSEPGVEAASMSNIELVAGPFAPIVHPFLRMPGQTTGKQGPAYLRVAPGFFETMRIRMITGRDFTDADLAPEGSAVIVNEAFVRRYFPGSNALGRRFERVNGESLNSWTPQIVVGVVSDAKYNSLRESVRPTVYEPLRYVGASRLAVRTAREPGAIAPLLRQVIHEASPDVRVNMVELESTKIANGILPERLLAMLAGFFVVVSAAMAAVGLYGVLSYSVSRQTREIGIRFALGAPRDAVAMSLLSRIALAIALGAALGLAAGLGVARYMESILFEVKPSDWTSAVIPLASLVAVAALATLEPLARAVRIGPGEALRHE